MNAKTEIREKLHIFITEISPITDKTYEEYGCLIQMSYNDKVIDSNIQAVCHLSHMLPLSTKILTEIEDINLNIEIMVEEAERLGIDQSIFNHYHTIQKYMDNDFQKGLQKYPCRYPELFSIRVPINLKLVPDNGRQPYFDKTYTAYLTRLPKSPKCVTIRDL